MWQFLKWLTGSSQGNRRRSGNFSRRHQRVRLQLESLDDRIVPSAFHWTGGAGDSLWTSAGNWQEGYAPNNVNADVYIPNGSWVLDNLPGKNEVHSITLGTATTLNSANANDFFDITGDLNVTAPLSVKNAGAHIGAPIDFGTPFSGGGATQNINVASGSYLDIQSGISSEPGGVQLHKTGPGLLRLWGIDTYTGSTYIDQGTIQALNDRVLPYQPVYLSSGAMFDLSGFQDNLGSLNGSGQVNLGNGGPLFVAAGQFSGNISGAGTLTLGSGRTLLGGQVSASQIYVYGQLHVTGQVSASQIYVYGQMYVHGTGSVSTAGYTWVEQGGELSGPGTLNNVDVLSGGYLDGYTQVSNFAYFQSGSTFAATAVGPARMSWADLDNSPKLMFQTTNAIRGYTYTLIQADYISGTFSGLPDGARFQVLNYDPFAGRWMRATFRIHYTSTSVTATYLY